VVRPLPGGITSRQRDLPGPGADPVLHLVQRHLGHHPTRGGVPVHVHEPGEELHHPDAGGLPVHHRVRRIPGGDPAHRRPPVHHRVAGVPASGQEPVVGGLEVAGARHHAPTGEMSRTGKAGWSALRGCRALLGDLLGGLPGFGLANSTGHGRVLNGSPADRCFGRGFLTPPPGRTLGS
jgi:hypothetical protein